VAWKVRLITLHGLTSVPGGLESTFPQGDLVYRPPAYSEAQISQPPIQDILSSMRTASEWEVKVDEERKEVDRLRKEVDRLRGLDDARSVKLEEIETEVILSPHPCGGDDGA
jgi:hypothetical protein